MREKTNGNGRDDNGNGFDGDRRIEQRVKRTADTAGKPANGNGNGTARAGNGNGAARADNGNGAGNGNGSVERLQVKAEPPRIQYDCSKCPGYCCSYKRISVEQKDLKRLARHFGIDPEVALRRFTKIMEGEQVLRHQKDHVYGTICMFFDTEQRRCTVYEARPAVCREYPERSRCGYYEFLRWERKHQDDPEFVPLT